MNSTSFRITVADALRGFAIMCIVLLHSIEHFNFYSYPAVTSQWLKFTDKAIWDSLFFTFGGKAYGIFALLFGFSFFIQYNNEKQKGNDFRLRFLWRLFLLFIWGNINAMFFTGEILVLYSIVGIVLIFVVRLSTKTILILSFICLLQPMEWYKVIAALINPDAPAPVSRASYYFGIAKEVQANGNFIETVKMNLWEGQLASLTWAWEHGRMFQTAAYFMMGLLLGRKKLFINTDSNLRFWRNTLIISIICFFPLNGLAGMLRPFIDNPQVLTSLRLILTSLAKFSFMFFIISVFVILYYSSKMSNLLEKLAPYGKMSLTCYITQSIVGSILFYNWGFGLHSKLGITYSFLAGICIFLVQYIFAVWWFKRYKHGPLEYIWKKATWIGVKR